MTVQYQDFVRKPFKVRATLVTPENMEELSKHIGEVRTNDEGEKYIFVDKRLVPNVNRVFVGFWVTQFGDNVRCFSDKSFRKQFTEYTEDWAAYFEEPIPQVTPEVEVVVKEVSA